MPTLKLQTECQTKGLTQSELAKIMGTAKQSVSNWENGICILKYEVLKKLSDYFGKSIDYLLEQIDDTNK